MLNSINFKDFIYRWWPSSLQCIFPWAMQTYKQCNIFKHRHKY